MPQILPGRMMDSSISPTNNVCVVGYALNAKKMRKGESKPDKLTSSASKVWKGGGLGDIVSEDYDNENNCYHVKFLAWDWKIPISEQPHFDVIIHKLTEDIYHDESSEKLRALTAYLEANPTTILINSISSVKNVISRPQTCQCLERITSKFSPHPSSKCLSSSYPFDSNLIQQPKYFIVHKINDNIIELMEQNGLKFPIICKPLVACGVPNSHFMAIILSKDGLHLINIPCLVQQYHDHNERFYKVYVIGDDVMVFQRPSLPNIEYITKLYNDNQKEALCVETNGQSTISPYSDRGQSCCKIDLSPSENRSHSTTYRATILPGIAFDSRHTYPTIRNFMDISHDQGLNTSNIISEEIKKCDIEVIDEQNPSLVLKTDDSHSLERHDSRSNENISIDCFRQAAEEIKREFGLSLFGFDVILPIDSFHYNNDHNEHRLTDEIIISPEVKRSEQYDSEENQMNDERLHFLENIHPYNIEKSVTMISLQRPLVVIDVNYFPSYKEVSDFPTKLLKFLRQSCDMID